MHIETAEILLVDSPVDDMYEGGQGLLHLPMTLELEIL